MLKWLLCIIGMFLVLLFTTMAPAETPPGQQPHSFEISGDVGDAMARQAEAVKEQFEERARSLFQRTPLGWNVETIEFLYAWALALPLKIPDLAAHIYEQSRLLGFVGSMLGLVFLVAVFYSVFGHRWVMALAETRMTPYKEKIPQSVFPFLLSALRVVTAASFPLLLLFAFALLNEMIDFDATWFKLIGNLLTLWAIGALAMGLMRELLTGDLFAVTVDAVP